jgi:AraC family transcriptional regulator
MSQIENVILPQHPSPVAPQPWVDIDTLSGLLAAASASVDSDKAAAKACIQRAAELLGDCRSRDQRLFQSRPSPRGGFAAWRKTRVTAYVEANLGSQITVTDLARIVQLSTGYFFRAFRESFGESPLAYVARQRIRRSQQLMLSSRATLAQIAIDCGMFDQPHFTRVFRKLVGLNPSAWRREFSERTVSLPAPSRTPARVTAGIAPLLHQSEHVQL